jgi:hypothetical protein
MKVIGLFASLWAAVGICALLGTAIWRLSSRASEALRFELSHLQWILLVLWAFFMAYAEGFKGFQKSFSPRTAARIYHLASSTNLLHSLLAPFFGMGYFHATKRTKIVAYSLTIGITLLVILVRLIPQPWRGIIDAGVVVGLTWGVLSLIIFILRSFVKGKSDASPELPNM